jgi:hypothetical protein
MLVAHRGALEHSVIVRVVQDFREASQRRPEYGRQLT